MSSLVDVAHDEEGEVEVVDYESVQVEVDNEKGFQRSRMMS